MQNTLIQKVAGLMNDQSGAYARLESLTAQLTAMLVRGEPNTIEALSKAGETELMRMRSRLLEITNLLTNFTELREAEAEKTPLETAIRENFDTAAKELLQAALKFKTASKHATSLALGGSSFSGACIQMCGVPPRTYNAPVLKQYEGAGRC